MRHKSVIVTALRNETPIIERIPPRQHRHDGDNQRMTHSIEDLHVYLRSIKADERTSLSVLASLVHPEAVVLDLGCGSGALGQYLKEHRSCTMDGLTLSEAEAEHARPHYRRVEVSDLETCDLLEMFSGQRYDYIICADVLEHLRKPERILQACRQLLSTDGKLLISVPNAAYCGLIAELLQGEFRYREEGLLDKTHLRFFTRRSLTRFLNEQNWSLDALDVVTRELPDSEFQTRFDNLPPAVARHMLGTPDALTYQFIGVARPISDTGILPPSETPLPTAKALFTSQLYLGTNGEYAEDKKLTATGVMGEGRQTLRFELPGRDLNAPPVTHLRLDPADRPGFAHLYALTLRGDQNQVLWRWTPTNGLPTPTDVEAHQQIVWQTLLPAASGAVLVLLTGDDPWFQISIPSEILATATQNSPHIALDVEMGWPMSADYLALSSQVLPLQIENSGLKKLANQTRQRADDIASQLENTQSQLNSLTIELQKKEGSQLAMQKEKQELVAHRQILIYEHQKLSKEFDALASYLKSIENSTVFRATRPLVNIKMKLDQWLGRTPSKSNPAISERPATPIAQPNHPVDIIVPVYRGLADTQLCINTVLASDNKTPYRLIVINDASPETEVTEWLRAKAADDHRIVLLENEANLGFVGTVNRGMAFSKDNDVLLLNSDTEVANDWLDRIRRAAYSDSRVGSVTPLSNNATICSYPNFCQDNELPHGHTTQTLDLLCAATNPGAVVDVPTGVGFCMYIRRDCLTGVGLFDVANFGKGYGEENDFCQRAHSAGWRNLHLLDTFVLHTGGVSFGASKSPREQAAMEILRRLHPSYEADVMAFVQADPARPYRTALDFARIQASQRPTVLAILHDRAGGTVRHVRELAKHLQDQVNTLTLTPLPGQAVKLCMAAEEEAMALQFSLPSQLDELLLALRALRVSHVHYHHLLGHQAIVRDIPALLGVAYDFTAHDFYSYCARISLTDNSNRYAPEPATSKCGCCPDHSAAPDGGTMAQWRAANQSFLQCARNVIAPSIDTARRIAAFAPDANVMAIPHTDLKSAIPPVSVKGIASGERLKVVVLGALSTIKGADVLEAVAQLAAKQKAPIDFHLLGYGYRHLQTQPKAHLTVHGGYEEEELPQLLEWLNADLVWFPAQWPETYSYTLSAALQAGLAIVAPDIGAFAERLEGREWSWVEHWDQTPADWLAFFTHIRQVNFVPQHSPKPVEHATAARHHTTEPATPAWAYTTDYMRGIAPTPLAPTEMSLDFFRAHMPALTPAQETRSKALQTLVWLRSLPPLRVVARCIPRHWQTQVKNWLRA